MLYFFFVFDNITRSITWLHITCNLVILLIFKAKYDIIKLLLKLRWCKYECLRVLSDI